MGNPVRMVDPDGRGVEKKQDDYGIDDSGRVRLLRKTKDKTDKLIVLDKNGKETEVLLEVKKGILSQLAKNEDKVIVNTYWGELKGTYANFTGARDALRLFKFVSDNSDVEWGLIGSKKGSYTLGTLHDEAVVGGLLDVSNFSLSDLSFDYHSHPGKESATGDVASDGYGDQGHASRQISKLLNMGVSYEDLPRYYIYRPHVKRPYRFEYSPWSNKFNSNNVYSWKNL